MNEFELKVAAAAEKLVAEGKKVTGESVRTEIGGGSLRDVCPALRKWREAKAEAEAVATTVPEEVLAAFRQAQSVAWSVAEKRALERVSAVEVSSNEKVAMAEAERDEALVEISHVEAQVDTLCHELLATREAITQGAAALARAETERDAALSKIEWLDEALAQEKRTAAAALDVAAELRGRIAAMSEVFEGTRAVARLNAQA